MIKISFMLYEFSNVCHKKNAVTSLRYCIRLNISHVFSKAKLLTSAVFTNNPPVQKFA